ncbi:MAG: hypothetical protein RL625_143 [Gemmatimonadota bacterium]
MKNRYVARLTGLLLVASTFGCVSNDDYEITDVSNKFEVAPLFVGVDEGIPVQMTATQGGKTVAVTWESSNTSVATVNATGRVSTNCTPAAGATSCFAAITATQGGGTKKSASLTVYNLVGIPLTSGTAVTGISGKVGDYILYRVYVPEGATSLKFEMSGGTGDFDLYVRRGTPPTYTQWQCRPYAGGNNETCTFANPASGTWYAMLDVYEDGAGVSLKATVAP